MGLMEGRPLHGDELIRGWQARAAAFPQALRRATVEHYLRKVFLVWYSEAHMSRRDARLWLEQELIQIAFSVLGVLAGLNRMYFSPFQFKRTHRFVSQMTIAPIDLADRIDKLFEVPPSSAIRQAEQLVSETLELVRCHLPAADVSGLRRHLGEREQPWSTLSPPDKQTRTNRSREPRHAASVRPE